MTTAVLIKSPVNPLSYPELLYRPARVDILFATPDVQPNRGDINDFCVTLYSDDGSDEHNPSIQVGTCYLCIAISFISSSRPLLLHTISQLAAPLLIGNADPTKLLSTIRGVWWQIDLTNAGWPLLSPVTYYWVAVTPCSPLTMTTQAGRTYNGALWVGNDDRTGNVAGPAVIDDNLFRGRQIISQRFDGDTTFGANTANAVNFNKGALSWGKIPAAQYTNWDTVKQTYVRYGIQLLGWQVQPPSTLSREFESHLNI